MRRSKYNDGFSSYRHRGRKVPLRGGRLFSKTFIIRDREKGINPFSSEREFLKEFIRENVKNTGLLEGFALDEGGGKEGYEKVYRKVLGEYHNLLRMFRGFPNPFIIYRKIGIDNRSCFLSRMKKDIGIFWSWEEEIDMEHLNKLRGKWIVTLKGKVEKTEVNWRKTLIANTNPLYEGECEVSLRKGGKVLMTGYKIERKEDVSDGEARFVRLKRPFFSIAHLEFLEKWES